MDYKGFEIKRAFNQYGEGYHLIKDNKILTQFVTQRALKKLIDRYYNDELNAFEKVHIFKTQEKGE